MQKGSLIDILFERSPIEEPTSKHFHPESGPKEKKKK